MISYKQTSTLEAANVFALYAATSALFVSFFFFLPLAKSLSSHLSGEAFIALKLTGGVRKNPLKNHTIRSFLLITLFIGTFLPVIRTLTAETCSDTIWLGFFWCQLVYCVCSSRSYILNKPHANKEYQRYIPIPLEESLLIPHTKSSNNSLANISLAVGFIFILSRIKNDLDALTMLIIGILFYIFIPKLLIKCNIHRNTLTTMFFSFIAGFITLLASLFPAFVFFLSIFITQLVCRILLFVYKPK